MNSPSPLRCKISIDQKRTYRENDRRMPLVIEWNIVRGDEERQNSQEKDEILSIDGRVKDDLCKEESACQTVSSSSKSKRTCECECECE